MITSAALIPFFLAPLLLTWFAPGWRWLLAFLALIAVVIGYWWSSVPTPPPEEETQGDFLVAGALLLQASAMLAGAVLGALGRIFALILRAKGVAFGVRTLAQVAPTIVAGALALAVPAWLDRAPSAACRSAVFDVALDGEPYRLPAAAIFSVNVLEGRKLRLSMFHERSQFNHFCGYARSRQTAIHELGVTFAVLHENARDQYALKPVDSSNEARLERLCAFGALTRTACALGRSEEPVSASVEVGVDERCVCTYGDLVYAMTGELIEYQNGYSPIGEGTTRTRAEAPVDGGVRFDITDSNPGEGWTSTRSYYRIDPARAPADVRGHPITIDCGAWYGEPPQTLQCRTTYPIARRTYLTYAFEAPPNEIAARAFRVDAGVRAMLADMRP